MIRQGIPRAIAFFGGQDPSASFTPDLAPAPSGANSPAAASAPGRPGPRIPPPFRLNPRLRPRRPAPPQ